MIEIPPATPPALPGSTRGNCKERCFYFFATVQAPQRVAEVVWTEHVEAEFWSAWKSFMSIEGKKGRVITGHCGGEHI